MIKRYYENPDLFLPLHRIKTIECITNQQVHRSRKYNGTNNPESFSTHVHKGQVVWESTFFGIFVSEAESSTLLQKLILNVSAISSDQIGHFNVAVANSRSQ